MKLKFDVNHQNHPDPFVLDDNGKYYLYPSTAFGDEGVRVYSATNPINGEWKYEGIAARFEGATNYWAPSVIRYKGKYYIYVSFERGESHQFMHVAEADSPLGPFKNEKMLYRDFGKSLVLILNFRENINEQLLGIKHALGYGNSHRHSRHGL